MKVLIVDDREENLYLLETLLTANGHEVVSANNGAVALEKLLAQEIELVISDILMPVMDGYRLCMAIQGNPALRHIPFLFYTATYTDERDEKLALDLGAYRFIRKPQEPEELIEIVGAVARDPEKAGRAPRKRPLEDSEDVLKLYNRRLVAKLEKKMLDLERELVERKRAERALQESEAYFQSVLEHAQDLIAVLDRDGTTRYQSPSSKRILGYEPNELEGRNALDLVHPDDRAEIAQAIDQAFANPGTSYYVSARFRHKEGGWLTLESTGSCYIPRDGPPRGVVNSRDVTEQRRVWKQMVAAQRMEAIGRLAGGVAHDFNNCLSVILSYASFLRDEFREGDPARDDATAIIESGQRAARLTRQLLAFSRHQTQRLASIDLNRVVREMDKMLRRLIGEDLDLVVRLADESLIIRGDEAHIEQILLNLAVNARDAMPDGGRLVIETAGVELDGTRPRGGLVDVPAGRYVVLTVTDTGTGMDEETRLHAFEPFFTTKADGKGTGLGLSTVHGIVRQSAGGIVIRSEPGQGAAFKIYLPRVEGQVDTGSWPKQPAPDGGTETILLVEDGDHIRKLARRILESKGYKVVEATNGGEGLILAERHTGRIDLMLTDMVMPHMSGRELADRLAILRPDMRVLFMSGYTSDAVARRGVLEKGMAFLSKPFTRVELLREVRQVLDSRARVAGDAHSRPDATGETSGRKTSQ